MTAFFLSYGFPIQFQKSIPESGSSISSFDFTLEFDISEALELAAKDKPGTEVGLGYRGGANVSCAILYRGDAETGIELGQSLTDDFNGKASGFEVNGNKIKMSFDSSIPIIANETYTVKIIDVFYLYVKGKTTKIGSTASDYSTDPIILTFKGEGSEKPQLECTSSNIENCSTLNECKSVEFTLSAPFNIKSGAEVLIKEGEDIVGRTSDLKVSSTDNKILVAEFNDVPMLLGHTYTIELPANSLTHIDDATVGNFIYKVSVNGNKTIEIPLKSSKVSLDSDGFPTAVTFVYDLPEGTTLDGLNLTGSRDGYLSVDGSEDYTNFSTKYTIVENGKGIKWDISSVKFEPATKYNFTKDGNTLKVFDSNNTNSSTGLLKEYTGEDASISFTTLSIEEAGFAPMEFADVALKLSPNAERVKYTDNMECESVYSMALNLKEYFYFMGNTKCNLHVNPTLIDKNICVLYEITPDGDKYLNSYSFSGTANYEDQYQTSTAYLNTLLYEGKKYKFVIPEGYFTAYPDVYTGAMTNQSKVNYIRSKEMVFTFTGTTSENVELLSCNVENNSEIRSLYNIVWTYKGSYRLSDEITTVKREKQTISGMPAVTVEYPVIVSSRNGKTSVLIDLVNKETGEPLTVYKGESYTFTMPKGLLVNVINDNIINDETVLKVNGCDEKTLEPETVAVNLTVNGMHSSTHPAIKGKEYSFNFSPAENWEVEIVKHGDKNLERTASGEFKTEPLTADADITADLRYNGLWASTDETTGIWEIEDKNIRIYGDSDHIVVDGVTPENTICVYNVAGMLINSTRVSDGKDRVLISVPLGHTYIVIVDGVAAKIMMKSE